MLMAHEVKAQKVSAMFGSIAERYDVTNSVLSCGIHWLWKRRIASLVPEGARVLDLCTGTGDLLPLLSKRASEVVGADFCLPMLEQAERRGFVKGNVSLVQADALAMPFEDNSFTAMTIAFGVRNFEDLQAGLQESFRVLAPGSKLLVLEFGQPHLPGWRELYNLYSRFIMPFIGGLLTGNREAYEYLPGTAAAFPCRDKFTDILQQCGFHLARYTSLSGGIAYIYQAEKP
jgi:demethylmenaquinone methyltransferase / 2-methoxy-6-polyprenyl-1,4-benzoquinol methylase